MADSASIRLSPGQEPYMQADRLQLRSYFPHEIDELSVVQITQTKTFDEIGHPVRGGLYDPRLGPIELFDQCETCYQQGTYCPGHMGYIQLDVPVFNPLLFSFTYSLMKGTCVHCHRFTCQTNGVAAKILLAQLRALDLGMLSTAHQLESYISEKFSHTGNSIGDTPQLSNEMTAITELDAIFAELSGKSTSSLQKDMVKPMKNAVELKRSLMHAFCRDHLFKHMKRCKLCHGGNGVLRNDGGRCILIDFSGVATTRAAKMSAKFNAVNDLMEQEVEVDPNDVDEKEGDKKLLNDNSLGMLNDTAELTLHKQLAAVENGTCEKLAWRAVEVREHFRMVWKNDAAFLKKLFPLFDCDDSEHCPMDVLFCEKVLVPPTKFRPIRYFKGDKFENPQTVNLRKLLEATETMRAVRMAVSGGKNNAALMELISTRVPGKTMREKMHNSYLVLQQRIGAIFDQDLDRTSDQRSLIPGIKQILEKKQGLFRMNMMGKRVNFACRSVITPDPYLDIDEIGIPEIFAKKLTFPEPASLINLPKLRKLVKNGPAKHPGANFVLRPGGFKQVLLDEKREERFAEAKRLQPANTTRLAHPVKVLRHLDRGDLMLMNRQPSLHKPSIMGHRVRVLTGQRALRMNYAPCKAYNADFDGDEMNGHFVQNRIAQTEVAEIANVGSNFLVPKDGTPLLGLIQDHVVSGVLLTLRGRFFNKEDFMHLVLAAFAQTSQRIVLPPPSMLKPQKLWSGKQVISTILLNCIPRGQPLINLTSKAKTPLSCWKVGNLPAPKFEMSESEVIFRQAELLVGVLDKQHYGSTQYGLIHCCWELYGHRCATSILSCFSRLFTTHLQYHGFTLGVADILVNKKADKQRKRVIRALRKCGDDVVKECFGLDTDASQNEIRDVMAGAYCNPRGEDQSVQQLDFRMKEKLNKFSEQINSACVPIGLIRSFPRNALQMMILSGSKGTMVNSMQISCGLGQIELEGRRPPITVTGRTLPSFRAFDTSPRAGGFVDQRFLTGINPQELFFHTMAGREGLIDTAVKTSRSGYLQRCIVKHLEGLVAHYDSTVRDHDNSVVQFRYGEDGMDVCKCTFMNPKQFDFLADNLHVLRARVVPKDAIESEWNFRNSEKAYRKVKKWRKRNAGNSEKRYVGGFIEFSKEHRGMSKRELVDMWFALEADRRAEYEGIAAKRCPDMVDEKMNPTCTLGALPEKMLDEIDAYVKKKAETDADIPLETFRKTLFWKGLRSRCDPGENVGLLAAQSIGEPSTQMTLNTFHFAGRGEMNVALGIPRLREILMTASTSIKTPSAEIRAKPGTTPERIEAIKRELDRVYLKQVIKKFCVNESINLAHKR
uniref:DNA-directed RNA polymerase subunit n=1 Tax=Ascaris suum TaxID=6253 RepID=F1KPQ2_ASCSU